MVIEVLHPQLHPQICGVLNVPGEKGHLLRGLSRLLHIQERAWGPGQASTHP